jgi:hypothetical protein
LSENCPNLSRAKTDYVCKGASLGCGQVRFCSQL